VGHQVVDKCVKYKRLLYIGFWEGLGEACPCQSRQQACPSLAKVDNWFNGQ
jgi:hypothetical protein